METVIVGERGQVTIPKKLRDRFGIKSKSPVVFELREDGIIEYLSFPQISVDPPQ